MNTARMIVLMVALSAGVVAAHLARGSDAAPAPVAPVAQLPTVDVLVAKSDIEKLVRADGSGLMAAALPAGMRAISTEISPRREKSPERNAPDIVSSEIILANVRVLAIDDDTEVTEGCSI